MVCIGGFSVFVHHDLARKRQFHAAHIQQGWRESVKCI